MRCYDLTIPASDHRFFVPTTTSLRPTKPVTRVTFGLGFPKAMATLNDGFMADKFTFYDLLGIPQSGSLTDIKHAYKQLALKYHPDVSPPDRVDEYTKRFIRVHEAYETLSDPTRRAMYDTDMARGIHLTFTARKTSSNYYYQVSEQHAEWKSCWQSQLSELKRRSENRDAAGNNMSWAARMRQQRDELSNEIL